MINKGKKNQDQVGMIFLARDAAVQVYDCSSAYRAFSRNNNCRLYLAPPISFPSVPPY